MSRLTLLAALALIGATGPGAAPAQTASRTAVKPTQELAALLTAHEAFSRPAPGSQPLGRLEARRPLTEQRTVLPVLGHATGPSGARWIRVALPGRPNGGRGWIRQRGTAARSTQWHIVVNTSSRRVTAYRSGRPVRTFSAIVGEPATPTPRGLFFVEEAIELRSWEAGAPYALALSARSYVLQEFAGGPGQIALHGLMNIGGVLGTAVSHGCVRLDNDAMRWLVLRIGPGVPVTITG